MLKLLLSSKIKELWLGKNYYSMISTKQFIDYFFPTNIIDIKLVNNKKEANVILWDTQDFVENNGLINIHICVENCRNFIHYAHYNKYGDFGDSNIQIYFYNHIDKLVITNKYIAIPVIYCRINYFNTFYKSIKPTTYCSFAKKKFCLFTTNRIFRNKEKQKIRDMLRSIGHCDELHIYKPIIANQSCYNSYTFINLMQQYKFVFVMENSVLDGYITEKIFNPFFARTIPIYNGSPKIKNYINTKSFIWIKDHLKDLEDIKKYIIKISQSEEEYNKILNMNKIAETYNDEDYSNKLKKFINNSLQIYNTNI